MKKLKFILTAPLMLCFGGNAPSYTSPPTVAPQASDASATAASDAEKRRRRAAASNTILTSPLGVKDLEKPQAKSLLGT